MKSLRSVSLLLAALLLTACSSLKPSGMKPCTGTVNVSGQEQSPYRGHVDKMLFRASMDIRKEHLSGLMLVKQMPDSAFQIVFTNEIGMTFFSFILHRDAFETVYCFGPMDKPALIRLFRTCFELMLSYHADEEGRVLLCDESGTRLALGPRSGRYRAWSLSEADTLLVEGMTNFSDRTRVSYSRFAAGIPQSVDIHNPFINLRIRLEMISF